MLKTFDSLFFKQLCRLYKGGTMSRVKYLNLSLLFLLLLMYSNTFAAEYDFPKKPASVDVADIDMDGDLDILLGHDPSGEQGWGGISVFENNSNGEFYLIDSLFILSYQPSLIISLVDSNEFPDFIAKCYDYESETTCFEIIYNYCNEGFNNINLFSCNETITISNYNVFYLDSISLANIVFISNIGFLWGILYNDGTGQFSSPEYYNLDYPPNDLAVGDLNGDEREDILIASWQGLDAWLNYETGLEYTNIIDSSYASKASISDVDNDGDNDIITTDWGMPGTPKRVLIYSNDGFGNFTLSYSKWIYEAMANIFVSDLNNDNYPDVIYNCSLHYPNSDYEIFHTYILFNNQDGTFQDPVNYYTGICSHKSHSADLDGNGWNDIITLNYDFYNPPPDTCSIHILFNDGTGNFVEDPQVGVEPQYQPISEITLSVYPNPFNISTIIKFSIKEIGFIELKIYDIKGRLIKRVINQKMKGGEHNVIWNGKDENNQCCSSGLYLMNLKLDGVSKKVEKVILLK